nr:xylulose kinase-1 [Tanacetum cinerariifolium]
MAFTFADTHNMIAYLTKSDASEGFDQIINFLNASLIKYALTVNPNIYVSCIKQFWSSVLVKNVNDVTRLQALVDKKKVIITEATIKDALLLNDVESINCLPNEEILTELSRMGAQVGDLSSHSIKYSSPALTQKVFANMRRVGKGFSGVDTSLFKGMTVAQQDDDIADEGAASVVVDDVPTAADEPTIPSPTPTTQPPPPSQDLPSTSQDKIAQSLEITKLKQRVKKLERRNKLKVSKLRRLKRVGTAQRVGTSEDTITDDISKQGSIISCMVVDEDVTLKDVDVVAKDVEDVEKTVDIEESVDVQGRQIESQAQIYQIDLEHADKVLSMQDDKLDATITAADTPITDVALTAAPSAARRRKGVVIRDPEETATPSIIINSEAKSKDKGKGILRKEKKDNAMMRYQALKRKPQTKAQARKNMMIYLRNMAGFKMDYFKGIKYDDIYPIFKKYFNSNVAFLGKTKDQMEEEDNKALKRTSKSQAKKAAMKQNLDEEVADLKRHLQIVPNNEDDVYTKATPLARKGRLEVLWQLVKERFASSKPKNFLDDFLLTTLTYMFEIPDV